MPRPRGEAPRTTPRVAHAKTVPPSQEQVRGSVRPPNETSGPLSMTDPVPAIRLAALRLCELIADALPKGARLDKALDSIKAGTRLGIEDILFARGRDAGTPKARDAS